MKEYKTLRINKKTHTLLRQKALDNEITVIKLLDKILKSYYKINPLRDRRETR